MRALAAAAALLLGGCASLGSPAYLGERAAEPAAPAATSTAELVTFRGLSGALDGRMSLAGLPPVAGTLELTREALIFRRGEAAPVYYPLYRQRRREGVVGPREPAVSLLDVVTEAGSAVYLFHLDGAVFETRSPGMLLDLVDNPAWLDSLGPTRWAGEVPLANPADDAAMRDVVADLVAGSYADSLFELFGRPSRPVGLIGDGGRAAGRLGEYIASRDSLSLAPDRMISRAQLRHGLAHELAHRWQRKDPGTLKAIWRDVPPIRDSLRYGYGSEDEQQAEAVAFAVHYLQVTSRPGLGRGARGELLATYERLVPGTGVMVRHLLTRSLYRWHPEALEARGDVRTVIRPSGCSTKTSILMQRAFEVGRRCAAVVSQ